MAYLHCHNCKWQQDDFWDRSYNPLRSLLNWEDALLDRNLDESFTDDADFVEEHGNLTVREALIAQLARVSRRIRDMNWRTQEEWLAVAREVRTCPECGSVLDID